MLDDILSVEGLKKLSEMCVKLSCRAPKGEKEMCTSSSSSFLNAAKCFEDFDPRYYGIFVIQGINSIRIAINSARISNDEESEYRIQEYNELFSL